MSKRYIALIILFTTYNIVRNFNNMHILFSMSNKKFWFWFLNFDFALIKSYAYEFWCFQISSCILFIRVWRWKFSMIWCCMHNCAFFFFIKTWQLIFDDIFCDIISISIDIKIIFWKTLLVRIFKMICINFDIWFCILKMYHCRFYWLNLYLNVTLISCYCCVDSIIIVVKFTRRSFLTSFLKSFTINFFF